MRYGNDFLYYILIEDRCDLKKAVKMATLTPCGAKNPIRNFGAGEVQESKKNDLKHLWLFCID